MQILVEVQQPQLPMRHNKKEVFFCNCFQNLLNFECALLFPVGCMRTPPSNIRETKCCVRTEETSPPLSLCWLFHRDVSQCHAGSLHKTFEIEKSSSIGIDSQYMHRIVHSFVGKHLLEGGRGIFYPPRPFFVPLKRGARIGKKEGMQ